MESLICVDSLNLDHRPKVVNTLVTTILLVGKLDHREFQGLVHAYVATKVVEPEGKPGPSTMLLPCAIFVMSTLGMLMWFGLH